MDELDRLIANLNRGAEAALDAVAEHGRALAAAGTRGDLAASIQVRITGPLAREVFTDKPYAGWVEDGRPGFGVKNAKALRFEIDGRVIFARSVGPAPARHFMSNARADLHLSGTAGHIAQEALDRELGL